MKYCLSNRNLIDQVKTVGDMAFQCRRLVDIECEEKMIYYNMYNIYTAYYRTMDILKVAENSHLNVHNTDCGMVLNMWFLSIEAHINMIIRLIAFDKQISEDENGKLIKQNLPARFRFILDEIGCDKDDFNKKTNINSLLWDFCTFRNEYLHNKDRKQKYQKAVFSQQSSKPILSDLIQAMVIFINIASCFQNIFSTVDFMPVVILEYKTSITHEKIDIVYENIIYPYINKILSKLNLYTDIVLGINSNSFPIQFYNQNIIRGLIKTEETNKINPSICDTDYYTAYTSKYMKNESLIPNTIRFPDMIREHEKNK